MKLSEALSIRADLQKRMARVLERACNCATYQEGTQPPEDANVLYREYGELAAQCEVLVQRINQTNAATRMHGAQTISDAIAARDTLRLRADAARRLADAAVDTSPRIGRSEIRTITSIDVPSLRAEVDSLMTQHRLLDHTIQAFNWETDLID